LVVFAEQKKAMLKAARIHNFGPPSVIVIEELSRQTPGHDEALVRVAAAGGGGGLGSVVAVTAWQR